MSSFMLPQSFHAPVVPGAVAHVRSYPRIEGLDDVLPRIRPNTGIRAFTHDDLVVVRYTSAIPDTFQTEMDLECRSLIFDAASGALLSRPLHKFFNLGERQGLDDLHFDAGARLELKLDGSMVAGFVHRGAAVLHTRGGLSDQARRALDCAPGGVCALILEADEAGVTPVFEWTAPDNRVVIPYDTSRITLLAIRDRRTGAYREDILRDLAARHGVATTRPIATDIDSADDFARAYAKMVERDDIEGGVLLFPDGHRVKVKTADYLRRHKILANLGNERYAYQAWLDDVVDDTASALGGQRATALLDFARRLEARIDVVCELAHDRARPFAGMPRSDAAARIRANWTSTEQALVFAALSGDDPADRVRSILEKRVAGADKRQALKNDLGLPDWDVDLEALR